VNAEEKQALIEWLKSQIHKLETACDEIPFGLDADDALQLQAMHATLAALTAKPIGYIDPATLKEYRGKRAGGSWSAEPKSGEYNQTLPIFTTPPVAALEQPHHNGMMMLSQKLAAAEAKLAELAKQPPVGNFYEDGPGNWWQIGPHDKVPHVTPLFDRPAPAADLAELVPDGWKLVPVEPTERMVIDGFESEPNEFFSSSEEWEAYEAMSGCRQATHRARLCWAAMLAAAPKVSE